MSFEDYVKHIANKYKLSAATAVLNSKPKELTIEEHIADLKAKIQNKMEVDDDVTLEDILCSDDFEFQDKDFETQVFNENDSSMVGSCSEDHKSYNNTVDFKEVNDIKASVVNNIATSIEHSIEASNVDAKATSMQVDESDAHGRKDDETNSLMYVLKTLQDIDQNAGLEKIPTTSTQITFCEESQSLLTQMFEPHPEIINFHANASTSKGNYYDFLQKENDSVNCTFDDRIVSKVANNLSKRKDQSCESNVEMSHKVLEEDPVNYQALSFNLEEDFVTQEIGNNFDTDESVKKEFIKEKKAAVTRNITNNNNTFVSAMIENSDEPTYDQTQNVIDTQATILYSLHGFTENTQISQSQHENIQVSSKFISGSKDEKKANVIENFSQNSFTNNETDLSQPRVITIDSSQLKYIIDKNTGKTYAVLPTLPNMNCESNNELNYQDVPDKYKTSQTPKDSNSAITFRNSEYGNSQTDEDFNKNEESSDNKNAELIPFKVIKELAKVKAFLKKPERRMSNDDSGYRSDSQHSFKSAHMSDTCVLQASHCLFSYLSVCRLERATTDVVEDIAQTLGSVIDRQHCEERCPPHFELIIEQIANTLTQLHTAPEQILEKDEEIQRLLLLNHSKYVLEYTIDKITAILQEIHNKLTTHDLYELENITQVENSCYIFYLLEILIQKYNSVKNVEPTRSSQSQEKFLKKSSITDIWKRKWNSNFKESSVEGSQRICVLTKCSEILNKIVIECMEGYSLVAFAALQCFNLMQN